MAEVLRVGNAGRFLDLLQFEVELAAIEDFAGIGIAVFLILYPHVGEADIAIEDVLAVFGIRLQIGGLQFLLDELGVMRRQVFLQVGDVALLQFRRQLLLFDLLFQDVQQMHRVGGDLAVVEVEHARQDLEREAGGNAVHAFVNPGEIPILLITLRLRVGVLQVLAVIHAHLGIDAGVFRLLQSGQHRELRQHFHGAGRAGRFRQRTVVQQLLVDLHLVGDAQAVRHLDDVDAVEEGFVVLVVAERGPFRLVAVRQHDAVERDRAEAFGTLVVAFLGGGQQRVQHLDRRLEHLDELQQALVGQAQTAGIAVGVRVVLGEFLQLANIHLADQGRNVLVVLVARLGLGDAHLAQHRRPAFDDAELGDVAIEFMQPLDRPGRQHAAQIAAWNTVILFQNFTVLVGGEQRQRRIVHRRILDRIKRRFFHQMLQLLRQRRLTAADRPEQIQNLFLLFQSLRGVAEVGNNLLDSLLHAVEILEGGINLDHLVGKQS